MAGWTGCNPAAKGRRSRWRSHTGGPFGVGVGQVDKFVSLRYGQKRTGERVEFIRNVGTRDAAIFLVTESASCGSGALVGLLASEYNPLAVQS